jgi:ferredoxin
MSSTQYILSSLKSLNINCTGYHAMSDSDGFLCTVVCPVQAIYVEGSNVWQQEAAAGAARRVKAPR